MLPRAFQLFRAAVEGEGRFLPLGTGIKTVWDLCIPNSPLPVKASPGTILLHSLRAVGKYWIYPQATRESNVCITTTLQMWNWGTEIEFLAYGHIKNLK